MIKKKLLLAAMLAAGFLGLHGQTNLPAKIPLTQTYFPDAAFRTYLEAKYNANVTTENKVKYIDRTAVNEINLNFANGKVGNITVNYTNIQSLEGIKLFVNLQKLVLPAISKTSTYKLGDVDVSGLKQLASVTNGTKTYTVNNNGTKDAGTTTASKFKISMTRLIADDCPKLEEVNLASYSSLKSISLGGTTAEAIKKLYLTKTGLLTLDISGLVNLTNEGSWSSYIDREWTDNTGLTSAFESMDLYSTFAVDNCSELTELTVGNLPLKFLSINYCDKLERIDLSGLSDLVRFYAVFHSNTVTTSYSYNDKSSKYNCNHQHPERSKGALKEIKIGTNHKYLAFFHCENAQLTNGRIDLENLAPTVKDLSLNTNKLTAFDVTDFKKLTQLDLGYNRIHHLDLPPNKSLSSLSISDNCLTRMDQFKPDGKLVYTQLPSGGGRIYPFQYIRKGMAYRYRLFDNPEDAQYVETADDTANQKYFWNISGGHLGNPENDETIFGEEKTGRKEDPRYFYFDSPLTDGFYWYRNPYAKTDHFVHDWFKVVLCQSEDIDFDPAQKKFYLVGDFNNWTPDEKHAFIYNPDTELYELQFPQDESIWGDFRIWDHSDPAEVTINLGGHYSEQPGYKGHNNHVFFQMNHDHKISTDPNLHYTRIAENETKETAKGITAPKVLMSLTPGALSTSWVRINGGTPTGIENISADSLDNTSNLPVEYYNLQGMRVDHPANGGIYIRRQGTRSEKVVVK